MNIVSLFPKAVGVFNYDKGLSKQELEYIHQQERFPNTGNTTSKDRNVLENPQFTELREFIQSSIDKYFQEVIAPDYDTRLRITQSWLN